MKPSAKEYAMRRRNFLAASLSSLVPSVAAAWTIKSDAAAAHPEGGLKPHDLVIVYNSKDPAEAAAAQELQSFLSRMTKVQPRVVAEDSPADAGKGATRFLVGRTPRMEQLISSGKIEDPAKKNGEAYVVQSIDAGGRADVAFLGGTGISTLYAVYHYLEKICGCGFYWDGDQVPHRESLPAQSIHISAQPLVGLGRLEELHRLGTEGALQYPKPVGHAGRGPGLENGLEADGRRGLGQFLFGAAL
jgi:hypothetical protein